jgi:hypothetical protein
VVISPEWAENLRDFAWFLLGSLCLFAIRLRVPARVLRVR